MSIRDEMQTFNQKRSAAGRHPTLTRYYAENAPMQPVLEEALAEFTALSAQGFSVQSLLDFLDQKAAELDCPPMPFKRDSLARWIREGIEL